MNCSQDSKKCDHLRGYGGTYRQVAKEKWSTDMLSTFFSGWRSPDGEAHTVPGIGLEVPHEFMYLPRDADWQMLMYAVRHCGEILVEGYLTR